MQKIDAGDRVELIKDGDIVRGEVVNIFDGLFDPVAVVRVDDVIIKTRLGDLKRIEEEDKPTTITLDDFSSVCAKIIADYVFVDNDSEMAYTATQLCLKLRDELFATTSTEDDHTI